MNVVRKYLIPIVVVFIVITLADKILHEVILQKLYLENSQLFRPMDEICKHKHLLWLANLIFSGAFCYIYSKGVEKKSWLGQGLRYGILMSMLVSIPCFISTYVIFPYPKVLTLAWLIGYTVEVLLAGLCVAAIYPKVK